MIQELVYTSAPRGLKPGVKGFCTVASTAGMAASMADRLESLSGYRHLFATHDENARLNPIIFSHVKIKLGSAAWHVLSRICDAGLDYSQRSNKLAHHVILDAAALAPSGPAWLLAQPGFMKTAWAGEPATLPADRKLPDGNLLLRVCEAWQKLTGDAGWAGVLAETALENPGRQVAIIFRPGMETFPLVLEALNLLPPQRRWEVTFSTFFNKLPPGIDCQWRFLVDGEVETKAAQTNPQTLVIDLCHPLSRAAGGELVEAARTGKVVHRAAERQPTYKLSAAPPTSGETATKVPRATATGFEAGGARQTAGTAPRRSLRAPNQSAPRRLRSSSAVSRSRLRWRGSIFHHREPTAGCRRAAAHSRRVGDSTRGGQGRTDGQARRATKGAKTRNSDSEENNQSQSPVLVATTAMPAPAVETGPQRDPFEDFRRLQKDPRYLKLPTIPDSNAPLRAVVVESSGELVQLYLSARQQVKLDLEAPVPGSVRIVPSDTQGEWTVERVVSSGAINILGTFALQDGLLTFQWSSGLSPAMKPKLLEYSSLIVDVDGKREKIRLRKPADPQQDLKLNLAANKQGELVLDLSPFLPRDTTKIHVQVVPPEKGAPFAGAWKSELSKTVPFNEKTTLQIPGEAAGMADLQLEISIAFDVQTGDRKAIDGQVTVIKRLVPPGSTGERKEGFRPLSLSHVKDHADAAKVTRNDAEKDWKKCNFELHGRGFDLFMLAKLKADHDRDWEKLNDGSDNRRFDPASVAELEASHAKDWQKLSNEIAGRGFDPITFAKLTSSIDRFMNGDDLEARYRRLHNLLSQENSKTPLLTLRFTLPPEETEP